MALELVKDNHSSDSTMPWDDSLKLFGHQFCPFTERVRLVCARKEIECDFVYLNLISKPEWISNLNLREKVPILYREKGPLPLFESLLICEYLDESHRDGPLICSQDCYSHARDRILIERVTGSVIDGMNALLAQRGQDEILAHLSRACRAVSEELMNRENKFIGSPFAPHFVDFMLWPLLERVPSIAAAANEAGKENEDEKVKFDFIDKNYSRVATYVTALKEDETIASVTLADETHYDFLMNFSEIMPGNAFEL